MKVKLLSSKSLIQRGTSVYSGWSFAVDINYIKGCQAVELLTLCVNLHPDIGDDPPPVAINGTIRESGPLGSPSVTTTDSLGSQQKVNYQDISFSGSWTCMHQFMATYIQMLISRD